MKRSKLLISIVVALTVVSMVFSSVLADGIPPVTVDPGEEENTTPVDREKFTAQPENFVPSAGLISVDGAAVPISPVYEYVYTKTPIFYFNRDFQATQYQIEVYSEANGATLYNYSGVGTCTSYYCSLKPSTKLKFHDYWSEDSGLYRWRVRAYVEGWKTWSSYTEFLVISKGYNDTFLTNTLGTRWWNISHASFAWVKTDTKSQLAAPGETSWWSTVFAKDYFLNIDYTVRMKRKLNATNSNAVIIWADLWPTTAYNELHDGIYFQYNNAAAWDSQHRPHWGIWKMSGGSFTWIQTWTPSSAIVPYGWNELRIVGNYPYVDVWINGAYLGWFAMSGGPSGGYTGVSMYYDSAPSGKLMVDWAKATPIQPGVYSVHDPAMELGKEPVPEGMDYTSAPLPTLDDHTGTR